MEAKYRILESMGGYQAQELKNLQWLSIGRDGCRWSAPDNVYAHATYYSECEAKHILHKFTVGRVVDEWENAEDIPE